MANPEIRRASDSFVDRIDLYLRREDTRVSKMLHETCPLKGLDYIESDWKRRFDYTIGVPAAVTATPLVIALATAKLIEDGHNPFFVHMRASVIGDVSVDNLPIWKIRCMVPNSDLGSRGNREIAAGLKPEDDPRNTRLGSFMRRYQLEELPQIYQVVLGRMFLFGPRAQTASGIEELEELWSPERFNKWAVAYNSGTGLSGLDQTYGRLEKDIQHRYHLDRFYYEHASLGLDMYLVWRTALRLSRVR